MYLHIFYDCTNYVCIENRYVKDKIAHKLISVALLLSLHGAQRGSIPFSDHNDHNDFNH